MNLKKVITFSGVMMILFSFVFFVLAYEGESYLYLVGVGQFLSGLAIILSNPAKDSDDNSGSKS